MRTALVVLSAISILATVGRAGEAYRTPPAAILDVLTAEPLPMVSVNPSRTHLLEISRVALPPLSDLAQPMLRLAGSRVNPATNARHGVRRYDGLAIRPLSGGDAVAIDLGGPVDLGMPSWSPDGSKFAFTVTRYTQGEDEESEEAGVQLWLGDTKTARARPITSPSVNAAMGSFRWMPDGRSILVHAIPADRGEAPRRSLVPAGPVVKENRGRVSPVRTYQDMLGDPHDEALFDYYMTSQLVVLDTETGEGKRVGEPGIFKMAAPSPDGEYLLVSRIERPYSYLVGWWSFPETIEVWTADAGSVQRVARHGLRDDVPIQGVTTGPRNVAWRSTAPSQLTWVEALDGGDPRAEASHRDRLLTWDVSGKSTNASEVFEDGGFAGLEPREVLRTEHRFSKLTWLDGGDRLFVREYDRERRWYRSWLVSLGGNPSPRLVWDRSRNDRYGDPGSKVMTVTKTGHPVAVVHEEAVYLAGSGSSPEGDLPFLDRMSLASLETQRLWRCKPGAYESVAALVSPDGQRVLTRYETKTDAPNYRLYDFGAGTISRITEYPDPAPQLAGMTKQLVHYERADGVPLSGTLYLPPGYEGGTLPLVVWAYPREFNDAKTAGQVRGSAHRFSRPFGTSHLFFLTQGFAVIDGAAMPVVGPPAEANDTFREQLVASARAAIDKMVEMGIADRDRVAIGGHSYGAFMTANLLAHSDLFAAGIARSGAYNRTLTPFGFQNERRTFWEAPMTYFGMSPFMHAEKIDEPMLLIHGQDDNNSGTFPIQSERLFHAMKGHGGTVRLVMLPYESHGYRGKESVLHVLAEMVDWLDRHVKGHPAPEVGEGATGAGAGTGTGVERGGGALASMRPGVRPVS